MSISFKVQYKKDKKTVKAFKTLEDFIQKASKKFTTQFDCEHYTFQFENDDKKMETVSNEKEYQDYLNSFELNEGDEYELKAKIKEKKETTKSKEEDEDVQEGKDIMQTLTQITQFLSLLDYRIKMDVLNLITEKQIEFVAQIKNDITKVCSDNHKRLINFRNNEIIRIKETSNNANIQTKQIPMNTFQNIIKMFQGGNQNQSYRISNVNQNIGYQGGTINRVNLMKHNSVSNMNRGYEQSSQNFQKPQEQMNFNLIQNSSSRPYDMQQYQTFSNNTNPNLQNRNSFEYYNGNILNSPAQNNQQQFDKVVNEGAPSMINNYNSASSSSSNLRFSYPSPNSFQPPVQNIQPIMQNVQPPVQNVQPPVQNVRPPVQNVQPPVQNIQPPVQNVQPPVQNIQPPVKNVQPPNNKLEPIQRPPEQEKTSANNLSEEEINKIMTELDEEYNLIEKWDESDIKDAIKQYNGNKDDIINYLYEL